MDVGGDIFWSIRVYLEADNTSYASVQARVLFDNKAGTMVVGYNAIL